MPGHQLARPLELGGGLAELLPADEHHGEVVVRRAVAGRSRWRSSASASRSIRSAPSGLSVVCEDRRGDLGGAPVQVVQVERLRGIAVGLGDGSASVAEHGCSPGTVGSNPLEWSVKHVDLG